MIEKMTMYSFSRATVQNDDFTTAETTMQDNEVTSTVAVLVTNFSEKPTLDRD